MRTIVIVDDEPIIRLDLASMLREQGFSVVGEASDGFDAVEVCRNARPDVVLMDIQMPVFDGLGAAETILKENLSACIIVISAFFDDQFIERATQLGVTGYLVKPIEAHRLIPAIEVAYAQSLRLREAHSLARQAQETLMRSRIVEQAKSLLAKENNISETEAYRMLQQLAMNKRCSIHDLAEQYVRRSSGQGSVEQAKQLLIRKRGMSDQAAFKRLKKLAEESNLTIEQAARRILAKQEGLDIPEP